MWLIEVVKDNEKTSHFWHNKHSDDFARFIPKNFGVTANDLSFYHLQEDDVQTFNNLMSQTETVDDVVQPLHYQDISENGKVKVKQLSDDALLYELTGSHVPWSSMYDENMNFILNN